MNANIRIIRIMDIRMRTLQTTETFRPLPDSLGMGFSVRHLI
jgi:hypothetical protein